MAKDIAKQIENINKSLSWIKKHRPEHYDQRFLQLVEERRKLRRIAESEQDNPAIAAYGVSQVGKSYLMNCMLQKNGKPFMLEANGTSYNFIEEMNPKTDNTEATGVVTRFTSFSKSKDRYSKEYPIMMRCLSLTDIVLIISDTYFNDLTDFTTCSEKELSEQADAIYNKYKNMPEIFTSPLQADNILDISAYFMKYLNGAQAFRHTDFFKKLALVANHIPSGEWASVFSILWNNSNNHTKLFVRMLSTLTKFKFARYVYLTPQALLHNGINEDTVMSVQCLNELLLPQPKYYTDVYLREGDSYQKLSQLTKSEVCAVCAEIVVKIDDEYLDNSSRYCFDDVAPQVASLLTHDEVKMNILRENDMLDFPGARSRVKKQLATLGEDKILIEVLLRGKVAYLFNMYNEAKRINILLYCHHHQQNDVADIPLLLKDWILNNIGDTMEKRRRTMELTEHISPLFYVGTKFNIDMSEKPEKIANEENALRGRWQQRFTKVLYAQCFNADGSLDAEDQKIFLNWTRPDEHFSNSYVLRDFKFSSPVASKLYDGEKTSSATMLMPRSYYDLMRQTFCESDDVKCFFKNPELAWDVAASINNDGALYIIENLSKIAATMVRTREEQFNDVVSQSVRNILNIMKEYYVSDDTAELLTENIRKANGIFREMEFACQGEPEYFGHLLQALQLSESLSYKELHRLIPTLTATVHDTSKIQDYELIRKRCGNFEGCKNENEKWQKFIETYRFMNQDEAAEYLKVRNIDTKKLFQGEKLKRKNSAIISDDLITLWQTNIQSVQFMNTFTGDGQVDEIIMTNLIACIINTAQSIGLEERIEQKIADYVDVLNTSSINEDLIADMVATTISDFIINFGYAYLTEEQIATSRRVAKEQHLQCFDWTERERKEHFEEDEMTELFNEILSSTARYTPAYEANYNCWLEYMYIAFIAHINVPDYDREANDELKVVLDELKA